MAHQTLAQTQPQVLTTSPLSKGSILQRNCESCGNHRIAGGECTDCSQKKRSLQSKLTIGASNDPLEQEADRVADQVMAASASPAVSSTPPRIQRFTGQMTEGLGTAPAGVERVLSSPGRPLDRAIQQDMGQRFNHDFSHVRVHTDSKAAESARAVNAQAYTVGQHVAFASGQYAPASPQGKRLLAHELAHVVQQSGSRTLLQRAETDTVPGCTALKDTQKEVDDKVNASLAAARATAGTPPSGAAVARGIENDLGKNTQVGRTAIEVWASTLLSTQASLPTQSATKYAGVSYRLWSNPIFPILNPTMKINGICVGSDKLGHFFQQGATFHQTEGFAGTAAAEEESERSEGGGFGLDTTGVFSNADRTANRQGGKFYKDLIAAPTMTFSIANYISSAWNEVDHPNFYEDSVGHQVWANVLTGSWAGHSWAGSPFVDELLSLNLVATTGGKVTGTFTLGATTGGKIQNGVITYNTTKVRGRSSNTTATPISGIHIDFDWILGAESGKGFLDSVGERHLGGKWGLGTSDSDRGTWYIDHT